MSAISHLKSGKTCRNKFVAETLATRGILNSDGLTFSPDSVALKNWKKSQTRRPLEITSNPPTFAKLAAKRFWRVSYRHLTLAGPHHRQKLNISPTGSNNSSGSTSRHMWLLWICFCCFSTTMLLCHFADYCRRKSCNTTKEKLRNYSKKFLLRIHICKNCRNSHMSHWPGVRDSCGALGQQELRFQKPAQCSRPRIPL